jgi:hypothetical protein
MEARSAAGRWSVLKGLLCFVIRVLSQGVVGRGLLQALQARWVGGFSSVHWQIHELELELELELNFTCGWEEAASAPSSTPLFLETDVTAKIGEGALAADKEEWMELELGLAPAPASFWSWEEAASAPSSTPLMELELELELYVTCGWAEAASAPSSTPLNDSCIAMRVCVVRP